MGVAITADARGRVVCCSPTMTDACVGALGAPSSPLISPTTISGSSFVIVMVYILVV